MGIPACSFFFQIKNYASNGGYMGIHYLNFAHVWECVYKGDSMMHCVIIVM